ncbi:uncharacterized protein MCYG_06043 [Microsporum canis CBS 113480]|uniref:Uncharacterized protein n=1 Tax=Arthroderma otae (strain ATCC MYA-4605 / CBS 113480) TaxID=554155 RepID=C5FTM1_ARTOC|nr:uncharacterized protein MCYG_06043 [Microsporum canis CBS 113480]EEQ33224.1 predicted protein [Microsporum canis CBS 113480]
MLRRHGTIKHTEVDAVVEFLTALRVQWGQIWLFFHPRHMMLGYYIGDPNYNNYHINKGLPTIPVQVELNRTITEYHRGRSMTSGKFPIGRHYFIMRCIEPDQCYQCTNLN